MKRILCTLGFMEVNHARLKYFIDSNPTKKCSSWKQTKKYRQKEVAFNLASKEPHEGILVYVGLFTAYLTPEKLSALDKPLKQWILWGTESFVLPLCCSQYIGASFLVGSFDTTITNNVLLGWSLWFQYKEEKLIVNLYFKIPQLFQLSSANFNLLLTAEAQST